MRRVLIPLTLAFVALCSTAATASAAPGVSTKSADQVTADAARLRGAVNPKGAPTTWYFEYGRTNKYGAKTANTDAGSGNKGVAVNATVGKLRPLTTYHYRLVAFSTAGTTRSADKTFKTKQIPTTSTIAVSPNPAVFGDPVLVNGTLTGPSVGGKQVALQGTGFPFTTPFAQLGNKVVTSSSGAYGFVIPAGITSQLRVRYDSSPDVISPVATLTVAMKATLRAKRSKRDKRVFSLAGGAAPAKVGAEVLIQRETSRGWKTVTRTRTKAATTEHASWRKRTRINKGGSFRAVVISGNGDYADGASSNVRISIR